MKNITIWILLLLTFTATADFDEATEAYMNSQFTKAYIEYERLAKIGNKRAQYNLGVMYLKGEHVSKDPYQAYAWGKLSEHPERPEFSQITKNLSQTFSPQELQAAEDAFNTLDRQYGEAEIYSKLSPIVYQPSDNQSKNISTHQVKIITRKAPRYPSEAYYKRIQGWVTVGFEIHPDGSARNPYVIDAYPEDIFENETLKAVQRFKFEVVFEPGAEPSMVFARQTIEYSLANLVKEKKLREYYDQRLQKLNELAAKGSAKAQYLYAVAASSNLINKDQKMPQAEVNDWLLKSAQNGHIEAQYHLGKNILKGKGCKVEKQKAIDWIVFAAEQGHPRSSRLAYSLLTKYNNLNNTDKPAEHWLKMSADNGDADAQIDYAEFLVKQEAADVTDLILARKYLEKQADQRDKSVKWYKVSSSIYTKQNKLKKAKNHLKKADKLAKKLGWQI